MADRRAVIIAAVAAVAAAGLTAAVAYALADEEPAVDGEFVLEEPGVYQEPTDELNPQLAGDPVPDVGLLDVDGGEVSLTDYAGQPLIVNLWYAACAPCARELRDFAEVHTELGDEVAFVGVNPYDGVERMLEFAGERGVAYDLLRDDDFALANDLGVVLYPVTLFVDADGRIVDQTGEIDADGLRAKIGELFG